MFIYFWCKKVALLKHGASTHGQKELPKVYLLESKVELSAVSSCS